MEQMLLISRVLALSVDTLRLIMQVHRKQKMNGLKKVRLQQHKLMLQVAIKISSFSFHDLQRRRAQIIQWTLSLEKHIWCMPHIILVRMMTMAMIDLQLQRSLEVNKKLNQQVPPQVVQLQHLTLMFSKRSTSTHCQVLSPQAKLQLKQKNNQGQLTPLKLNLF